MLASQVRATVFDAKHGPNTVGGPESPVGYLQSHSYTTCRETPSFRVYCSEPCLSPGKNVSKNGSLFNHSLTVFQHMLNPSLKATLKS